MMSPLAALSVLVLGTTAFAAGNRPEMPALESNVPGYNLDTKDLVFPTGLRVILQRDTSAPVVAISTVIDAGSMRDPAGKEGLAHLTEHLWFQSTHSDLKTEDVLFEVGAVYDAATQADYMSFTTLAPVEALPYLIRMESLRLQDALAGVEASDFDRTRDIVSMEPRYRFGTDWQGARPELFRRLFPEGHPYQNIGSGEKLESLTLSDAKAFASERLTAANTTIAIVGNFDLTNGATWLFENLDPKLMHPDLTDEHIRSWARPGIANPDPENPEHVMTWPLDPEADDDLSLLELDSEATIRISDETPTLPDPEDSRSLSTVTAPVKDPVVVVAWTVPGAYRGQESIIQVTAQTLQHNIAGSFIDFPGVKMRGPGQPNISCFSESHLEATLLVCAVEVESDANRDRIASTMTDQVAPLWNPDLRQALQTAAQAGTMRAMTNVLHSLDIVSNLEAGRAQVTSRHAHFTGSPNFHSDTLQAISQSQAEAVGTFANQFLQRNRAVLVSIEPMDKAETLPGNPDGYHGAVFRTVLGEVREPIDAAAILEAYSLPDVSSLVEKTLPNGLKVVVIDHGEAPSVRVSLVYRGGLTTAPLGLDSFSHSLQYRTLLAPEQTKNPLSINGVVTLYQQNDFTVEALKGSAGNLDGLLWLLRDQAEEREPVLYSKNAYLRQLRDGVKSRLHNPWWWAVDLEDANTLPGHPGRWLVRFDDVERLKLLGATEVREYLELKYQPSNATLLIVGAVDPDAAMAEAEKQFGGWKDTGSAPTVPLSTWDGSHGGGGVYVFDTDDARATVRFRCAPTSWSPSNRATMDVMSSLYDEQARVALAALDGSDSPTVEYKELSAREGRLMLNLMTDHEQAGEAAELILSSARALAETDDDRRMLHQLRIARSTALHLQSIDQLSDKMAELAVDDERGWDWYQARGEALANLTAEELAGVVQSCVDSGTLTLQGPIETLAPQLKERGIDFEEIAWLEQADAILAEHDPKALKKLVKDRKK